MLVACIETEYHIVSFYVNGELIESQLILQGDSATTPIIELEEGYVLVGWDKSYNKVKDKLDVNAIIALKEYTVFYFIDNNLIDEITYNIEDKPALLYYSDEIYEVINWLDENNEVISKLPNRDVVLKGVLGLIIHEVNYYIGDTLICTQEYKLGDEQLYTPNIPGYNFVQWEDSEGYVVSKYPGYSIDLYAAGNYIQYEVNYYDVELIYSKTFTILDLSLHKYDKNGFVFEYWVDLQENIYEQLPIMNLSLYAYLTPIEYEIKLHLIDEEIVVIKYYGNNEYNLSSYNRKGYRFINWEDINNVVYEQVCMTNIELYEISEILVYTLYYKYNGKNVKEVKVDINSYIDLSEVVLDGYNFNGWYLESTFNTLASNLDITINQVLHGKYTIKALLKPVIINEYESFSLILRSNIYNIKSDSNVKLCINSEFVEVGFSSNINDYRITYKNNGIVLVNTDGSLVILNKGAETLTIELKTDSTIRSFIDISIYQGYNGNDFDDKENFLMSLNSTVTRSMSNPYYWLSMIPNANDIVANEHRINQINDAIFASTTIAKKVVDLGTYADTISGTSVRNLIASYTYSPKPSGTDIQMNVNDIPTTVNIRYGLVINLAKLMCYPTHARTGTNNQYCETGLDVGDGVLIYHTSLSNEWFFVQSHNYYGWIETKNVVEVTKSEMLTHINSTQFVMVTVDRISFVVNGQIVYVRMGSKIPYTLRNGNTYTLVIPSKDGFKYVETISNGVSFNDGYLPYTIANTIKLLFRLLTCPYDWGDEFGGRDCSSTVAASYKCFGFRMPRNAGDQTKIPVTNIYVEGWSVANKKVELDKLMVGSLIHKSGHIMMYIGKTATNYYVINNISGGVTICNELHSSTALTTYVWYVTLK